MIETIQQAILNKARNDKFKVVIDTPKCLKNKQTSINRANEFLNRDSVQMSIAALNIPSQKIPEVSVPYLGQNLQVTSQTRPTWPPIKITFNIDNSFNNYWFVFKWLNVLNDTRNSGVDSYFSKFKDIGEVALRKHDTTSNTTYREIKADFDYSDYQTNITIFGLREYNEHIVQFNFYNAFPISLGEISYDYKNTDEIGCYFDFAYSQMDVVLIDPT